MNSPEFIPVPDNLSSANDNFLIICCNSLSLNISGCITSQSMKKYSNSTVHFFTKNKFKKAVKKIGWNTSFNSHKINLCLRNF